MRAELEAKLDRIITSIQEIKLEHVSALEDQAQLYERDYVRVIFGYTVTKLNCASVSRN